MTIVNQLLLTGGKDGIINFLDLGLRKIRQITNIESISPFIRAIDLISDESTLLVGTYGSEIIELSITSQHMTPNNTLIQGHYTPDKATSGSNEV